MGGSAAEEEEGRTGKKSFDRIWNPVFAMKDVVYVYVSGFGFEVLVMMFAQSPCGSSPSWELDVFIDYLHLQSDRCFSTLHINSRSHSCVSLRAGEWGEQNHESVYSTVLTYRIQ
jgi:hypothetical protein